MTERESSASEGEQCDGRDHDTLHIGSLLIKAKTVAHGPQLLAGIWLKSHDFIKVIPDPKNTVSISLCNKQ
jgi:hypothetical protein